MGYAARHRAINVWIMHRERTWVILLTGGGADPHGSKNERASNAAGEFSPSPERRSLFEMTLSRARSIVPLKQIVVIIERAQKQYWNESLTMLPDANVIVQPYHRGSATEVLLAVLTILERDPLARIIAMPSHHYVRNETALAGSLLDAATPTAQTRNKLTLIGFKPERADTESDYIVPGRWFEDGSRSVLRLLKPSGKVRARDLAARGALWDSSIVAARALVLLAIFRARAPRLVDQMETALAQGADVRQRALTLLHAHLPSIDLSRLLAHGAEAECRLITARSCGWSIPASAQGTVGPLPLRRVAAIA
jgi:mannose-1-phosphate guanylyltransferase